LPLTSLETKFTPVPEAGRVYCLSMISGQNALRLSRGKTGFHFPDHALFARLVSIVIWQDVIGIGRSCSRIAAPPRLGLSPLEIFAERLLQPVLS
jgi:hypothetical protein